jgi:HlyD family secretion protein
VKKVYPYPVSKEELVQTLGNQQIAQFLVGNDPAKTLLIIEPQLSDKTASGFLWTSTEGPPFTIQSGTLARVKLVIDEQPPISYLIPLWKIEKPIHEFQRSP